MRFPLDGKLDFYLKMILFIKKNDLKSPLSFVLLLNPKCDSLFRKCGLWKTKYELEGQVTYREGTIKTVALL